MVFPLRPGAVGPKLPRATAALPSPMARILLVRHGQSEWNADGRWQGQADPPLSELGEQQAVAAARALGDGRRDLRVRPRARAPHRRARRRAARCRRGRRAPPARAARGGVAGPHPRRDRRGVARATSRPGVDPRATSPTTRCSSGCSARARRDRGDARRRRARDHARRGRARRRAPPRRRRRRAHPEPRRPLAGARRRRGCGSASGSSCSTTSQVTRPAADSDRTRA